VILWRTYHWLFTFLADQQIAKRRNERFKRIKVSTLARLLRQSLTEESVYNLGAAGAVDINGLGDVAAADSISQIGGGAGVYSARDNQSQVSAATGASAASHVTYATEMLGITQNTTFLLLDLRQPEEYKEWHIRESINFPAVNIARDKTIPELFRFKNAEDKLIVIYMNDERQGIP
jgi:centrosomal protein CEP41